MRQRSTDTLLLDPAADDASAPLRRRKRVGDGEDTSIYDSLRRDILNGLLQGNARLKTGELATRYGTSTNPVREALKQLSGEGFVVIEPNRGARVRPIDEAFVRDIYEIALMIEPHFTRWFVGVASDDDVIALETLRDEIETLNFADAAQHSAIDARFHCVMYERHYNRHAFDLWWRHREILTAITVSQRRELSRARRGAVLSEHRALVDSIKAHDADRAVAVITAHVEGAGRQLIEMLRAAPRPTAQPA